MKNYIKTKILKGLLILIGIAVLFSCSKSFLKPDPLSFYEPTTTFSSESGLMAALAMADRHLRLMWTGFQSSDNNVPISTELFFSDMAVYGKTDAGGGMFDDINYKLTPTSGAGTDGDGNWINYYWGQTYTGIKYANTVINYVDGVKGLSDSIKNIYKGRAYFHRAYRYMSLVFQYGDVPLVTKLLEVPKQNYRSTKKAAILDMLTKDMEFAVKWVPDQKNMTTIGMVNKGACRQLLTKCYLATGQFSKAEKEADTLINLSGYSLMKTTFGTSNPGGEPKTWPITRNVIWDLHRPENKLIATNKEMIMGMPNSGSSTLSFTQFKTMRVFGPFWNATNITTPDGKQAVRNWARNNSNYNANYDFVRGLGRGIATTSASYFSQHGLWYVNGSEDNADLRHNSQVGNWVHMTDLKYNDKTSAYFGQNIQLYNGSKILCQDTIRDWFDFPLYKIYLLDVVDEANQGGTTFAGATNGGNAHWYLYRLAETYLLRAEAKFYQGRATEAAADVNEVRKRAGCSQLYTTVTIGDIANERARELYLEEWRHVELSRISYCLALSGKADEWGNTYTVSNYDKQDGTDAAGGSYWYQRIVHYTVYNKGTIKLGSGVTLNYTMNKHNLYWPIQQSAIDANNKGKLFQNFGYSGYDASIPEWTTWQDAVADESTN